MMVQIYSACLPVLGVAIELQEKLLSPQFQDSKPDLQFLESFAAVVGSKWPSLAAALSMSADEREGVRKEDGSHALWILKKWCSREDAKYCQLKQALRTISLFQ